MYRTATMGINRTSRAVFAPLQHLVTGDDEAGMPSYAPPNEQLPLGRLSSLVHDFRGPLTSLRLNVQLLREALGEDPWAGTRLRQAERSIVWLDSLVGDLLTLAAADDGGLSRHVTPVSMRYCAETAVAMAEPLFESVDQRVHITCPAPSPVAWGDSLLVQRVLLNLLSNAAKYGPPGDDIALDVSAAGRCVQVRVTDHGAGIPNEELSVIFERFVRGSTRATGPNGAGLGLAVCRAIVEQLGGAIGVDSAPGHGASFWFTLPGA